VTAAVAALLAGRLSPPDALLRLMARESRAEW